jgi:RNA polymerase sigma-70 factor (ECF subfamily)
MQPRGCDTVGVAPGALVLAPVGERVPARPEVDVAAAFREHYAFVYRVLLCTGVPRCAADDAVQDVFVTVHRRRRDYDGRAPLRHWVYGIAKGVGRNYGRKAQRRARRFAELPALAEPPEQEASVARARALGLADDFLRRLNPDQREVFVLLHVEGMTAPEVAAMVGVSVNTVYSRLRLARSHFEKLVAVRTAEEGGDGRAQ